MPSDRSRHAGLDREGVVDTALRLVESGGPEALTMRKLAGELGVTPNTLYWHVGGRDELVSAIVERQSERQADAAIEGVTANERVMCAARLVWTSALEHRELTRLAHAHGATSRLELGLEVAMARELQHAGLEGVAVRDALRSILICVGGFLVLGLRPAGSVPDELVNTAVWATVDDPELAPDVLAAFRRPADLEALFETTVQAVVDHWLPDDP